MSDKKSERHTRVTSALAQVNRSNVTLSVQKPKKVQTKPKTKQGTKIDSYERRIQEIIERTRVVALNELKDPEDFKEEDDIDEDLPDEDQCPKQLVRRFSSMLGLPRSLSQRDMNMITNKILNEEMDIDEFIDNSNKEDETRPDLHLTEESIDEFIETPRFDEPGSGNDDSEGKRPSISTRRDSGGGKLLTVKCTEITDSDIHQRKLFNESNLLRKVSSKGFASLSKENGGSINRDDNDMPEFASEEEREAWKQQVKTEYLEWLQQKVTEKMKKVKLKQKKSKLKPRWQLLFEQSQKKEKESE